MWLLQGDPTPHAAPEPYQPVEWQIGRRLVLAVPHELRPISLADALAARRSERVFAPIPDALLGAVLWHSARTLQTASSPYGFPIERRPTPSAGAIHPIHLILELPDDKGWARYNPQEHSLDMLLIADDALRPLVDHCEAVVPRSGGQLMLFVAEPGKTAAKYEHPESLVWRDAGVLQGSVALVAASLGSNFCLLGVTGNPWVAALADEGKLKGVGVAILGVRP